MKFTFSLFFTAMMATPYSVFASQLNLSENLNVPKVGDKVVLTGKTTRPGSPEISASLTQSILAFNSKTGIYSVKHTINIGGDISNKQIDLQLDQLMSDQDIQDLLTQCESSNVGKKEHLVVAAGEFDTCRVEGQNSTKWYGAIPFRIVKLREKHDSGDTLEVEASTVVFGK